MSQDLIVNDDRPIAPSLNGGSVVPAIVASAGPRLFFGGLRMSGAHSPDKICYQE